MQRAIIMKILSYNSKLILKTEVGWCEPWIFTFKDSSLIDLKILKRPDSKSMSFIPEMPNFSNINNLND